MRFCRLLSRQFLLLMQVIQYDHCLKDFMCFLIVYICDLVSDRVVAVLNKVYDSAGFQAVRHNNMAFVALFPWSGNKSGTWNPDASLCKNVLFLILRKGLSAHERVIVRLCEIFLFLYVETSGVPLPVFMVYRILLFLYLCFRVMQ